MTTYKDENSHENRGVRIFEANKGRVLSTRMAYKALSDPSVNYNSFSTALSAACRHGRLERVELGAYKWKEPTMPQAPRKILPPKAAPGFRDKKILEILRASKKPMTIGQLYRGMGGKSSGIKYVSMHSQLHKMKKDNFRGTRGHFEIG